MSPRLFDVYLVGSVDQSPGAQMRLATSIATRFRLAAPVVAEALGGAACRVGSAMNAREAQAMTEILKSMGALARVSPAGMPVAARLSEELASVPAVKDRRITLKSSEVDVPAVVEMSEAIEFAEVGPDGKTGVRGPDHVRCAIHGLMYNRRKASSCLRCLAGARAQAEKLREESRGHFSGVHQSPSSLRHNRGRRTLWGLAIALLIGFLPAAYYARRVNRVELVELRAQQAAVAAQPVTKETLARFDALDLAVEDRHRKGAGRTLLIWAAVAAAAGALWTVFTRPGASDAVSDSVDKQRFG